MISPRIAEWQARVSMQAGKKAVPKRKPVVPAAVKAEVVEAAADATATPPPVVVKKTK